MQKQFFIYILSNWNKQVLYIGVTSNLQKRIWEHKNHQIEGFTDKYNVEKLVYFEDAPDAISAIKREKQIKRWRREKKENLIHAMNPDWQDLSEEWYKKDPSTTLGMTIRK